MTVLRGSDAPVSLRRGKPVNGSGTDWVRPSDWLTLPTLAVGEQKVVGLLMVGEGGSNLVAVTVSGAYTVNWGDGTTENFAAGTTASRNIAWANISGSTLTSEGFRQAIVTITPQAGQNLTSVNFLAQHPTAGTAVTVSNWLDIAMVGSNISSLTVTGSTTLGMAARNLEHFQIVGPSALTNIDNLFSGCTALRRVDLGTSTASVTSANSTFSGCTALTSVDLFSTQNVNSTVNMFLNCTSLTTVPLFDLSQVFDVTQMFSGCRSLTTVPLFNTVNVEEFYGVFQNCSSLVSVPLFNTQNAYSLDNMFDGCSSLTTVPLFSFGNLSITSMFQNCTSLTTVPLFYTLDVVSYSSLFNGCRSLVYVPEFSSRRLLSSPGGMFSSCNSLQRIDFIPVRTSAMISAKLSSDELNRIYTRLPSRLARTITGVLDNGNLVTYTTSVAHGYLVGLQVSMTGITPAAYNLSNVNIYAVPSPTTFTIVDFTGASGTYVSGGTVTPAAATLTVTGNWGVAADTPSIATDKGWTVTG